MVGFVYRDNSEGPGGVSSKEVVSSFALQQDPVSVTQELKTGASNSSNPNETGTTAEQGVGTAVMHSSSSQADASAISRDDLSRSTNSSAVESGDKGPPNGPSSSQ